MNKFINVNDPLLDGNEKKYLLECIESGWISSEGPFVKLFEEKFAAHMGRKHAIAVNNGTSAIDAAVEALGIGHGVEVIVPTFTIISCLMQIVRAGATPVLVDCDPLTFNMNVSQIEKKITKATKAIMIVHIYGLPVDVDPILELAKKYNLRVIEDAAEMHGQTYKGKPCGSFGDISTFSFYPNKHITTGEGGMILTDDDQLADDCRSLRNLCFKPGRRFIHDRLGWNLRMTNLQAAIGLAQLERLNEFVERKRSMGKRYTKLLANIKGIQTPIMSNEFSENIFWVYGVVLDNDLNLDAEHFMKKLAEKGIGTRPFFYPMHLQPIFKRLGLFEGQNYPVSETISRLGFYLPSGLALTNEQIDTSAQALIELLS